MDKIIEIIILLLATYGLSSLLVNYAGPFQLLDKLRKKFTNSPLHCVVCTAFWVSIALFIVSLLGFVYYLLPLAIVAIVMILEKILW